MWHPVGCKTTSFLKVYMDYRLKEVSMQNALSDYVTPVGYRSSFKGVPKKPSISLPGFKKKLAGSSFS